MIDGIASLGDASALSALDAALRALDAGTESSALREVAARSLASAARPDAVPLAIILARDPNAGVRLDALTALAAMGSAGTPAGAWHGDAGVDGRDLLPSRQRRRRAAPVRSTGPIVVIVTLALSTDAWPRGSGGAPRLAPRFLRCQPPRTGDGAWRRDREGQVDARAHRRARRAGRVQGARHRDAAARDLEQQQAAGRVARPRDRRRGRARRSRARRRADPQARDVARRRARRCRCRSRFAQHAAVAVGRLAPPGAAAALLAALADGAFPEIVASAAGYGLGALGAACPPAAKAQLEQLATTGERQVTVAAKHAAAVCREVAVAGSGSGSGNRNGSGASDSDSDLRISGFLVSGFGTTAPGAAATIAAAGAHHALPAGLRGGATLDLMSVPEFADTKKMMPVISAGTPDPQLVVVDRVRAHGDLMISPPIAPATPSNADQRVTRQRQQVAVGAVVVPDARGARHCRSRR